MAEDKNFKYLVRIANTDLDGGKPIGHALLKIKGVGVMFSNMACKLANVSRYAKTGNLKDSEIEKLTMAVTEPKKFNAPSWLFNRRKDYETGEDRHIISGNLKFSLENDLRRMKKIRCYRGIRHIYGLPVRGQKTRSNFRRNKGKVTGVQRSKILPAKSEKAEKAPEKEKKK